MLLRTKIPIELTNGNDGRGGRWFKSAKLRKQYEKQLPSRTPFPDPVIVLVRRILGPGQRRWDSSSGLRGNWKEIEDALVARGWFHDDSPRWITHTVFCQSADRRDEGPCVEVEIHDGLAYRDRQIITLWEDIGA